MSSGLENILDFGFTKFGFCVRDLICRACLIFLLACIVCRFSYARVYCVKFIFLLGLKFIKFVGMSLIQALIWCE